MPGLEPHWSLGLYADTKEWKKEGTIFQEEGQRRLCPSGGERGDPAPSGPLSWLDLHDGDGGKALWKVLPISQVDLRPCR